jgi:hypothetical protein
MELASVLDAVALASCYHGTCICSHAANICHFIAGISSLKINVCCSWHKYVGTSLSIFSLLILTFVSRTDVRPMHRVKLKQHELILNWIYTVSVLTLYQFVFETSIH